MFADTQRAQIDSYTFNITSEFSMHEVHDLTNVVAHIENHAQSMNHIAPDFRLPTADGHHLRLSDYHGCKILLVFGATWGRLYQAQLPILAHMARESNIVVLTICSGETLHTLSAFVKQHDIPFSLLNDYKSEVKRRYEVTCLPTAFYIDEQGCVLDMHRGEITESMLNRWLTSESALGIN